MGQKTDKVKLSAVGDIMLGDLPACFGFGVGSVMKKHGLHFPFSKVTDNLPDTDILFGNLESILSNKGRNKLWLPTLYMRGDPRAVQTLTNIGFKVLSVSNNHMMQHGPEAFMDTINVLEREGICPIGLKNGINFSSKPFVIEIKGLKLGFLGYSLRPEEYISEEVLYCLGNTPEKISDDVHELKKEVDFVILSLHWGDEFIPKPSYEQITIGRALIDKGADIILGHHPHVLQGIEEYKGGLIAYSLGNFVFDMWLPETRKSMILNVYLDKEGIDGFRIIPLMTNNLYQPEVLDGGEERSFNKEFDRLCEYIEKCDYSEKGYDMELLACLKEYRKSVKQHYIKNILRYNLFHLSQLFFLIIFRRVFKKHI